MAVVTNVDAATAMIATTSARSLPAVYPATYIALTAAGTFILLTLPVTQDM